MPGCIISFFPYVLATRCLNHYSFGLCAFKMRKKKHSKIFEHFGSILNFEDKKKLINPFYFSPDVRPTHFTFTSTRFLASNCYEPLDILYH